MNAPYERALVNADCAQRSTDPADVADVRPDSVRVSSRPLGWKPLNIDTPVRWAWDTRLSFTMMSLEPEYLNKVARESFDFDPAQVRLKTVEGQRDPVISSIAGALMREVMSGDAGSRLYAESLA